LAFVVSVLGGVVDSVAADVKNVMIINSFGQYAVPYSLAASTFRSVLLKESGRVVDLYDVPLNMVRMDDHVQEGAFYGFLKSHLTTQPMDLVVPIGAPAARFVIKYRDDLFPQTPILLSSLDPRMVPPEFFDTNATMVAHHVDGKKMIEDMLLMQPETTNIMVVFGSTPIEKFWIRELKSDFETFTNRVGFTWLEELSLPEVVERCAHAPPRTFIFYGLFMADVSGVKLENSEPLRRIHAAAAAPIYGYFESELGIGSLGGRLFMDTEIGIQSARIAVRILNGERPENIPPHINVASKHIYDGRELRQWNIDVSRLPDDAEIRFKQLTYWEQYAGRTMVVLIALLLQALLIAGLLINRASRIRAEQRERGLRGRLLHAHEGERALLARELHDDITQRLAKFAIDVGVVACGKVDVQSMGKIQALRDGLIHMSEDVHALSYRLHPSVLDDLGLIEALKSECDRIARQEQIDIEIKLNGIPNDISKETALCLFRVTQEALRNVARHSEARHAILNSRFVDKGLELAIRDDGTGFDVNAFRKRKSLGLASMKERVELLDGEFEIDSKPGMGTTIIVWVPLKERAYHESNETTNGIAR
jgi:signal transduction histidine kinase